MVTLVVDDQISVVSGIFCGVNWSRIGIHKVYKALNALEARAIICKTKIDILLCDIEMPKESGLDLYRWILEQHLDITCILLTAHADFLYAQKALKLNVFDYLLQPAPYEEIEEVLSRAVKRRISSEQANFIKNYGQMIYNDKDKLIDALFQNFLANTMTSSIDILEDLHKLGYELKKDLSLYTGLITHFLKEPVLNNIKEKIRSVWEGFDLISIFFSNSPDELFFIFYSKGTDSIDSKSLSHIIHCIYDLLKEISNDISVYWNGPFNFDSFHSAIDVLKTLKANNIANLKGIFEKDTLQKAAPLPPFEPNWLYWNQALEEGYPETILNEIRDFLEKLPSNEVGAMALKNFHNDFIQFISVNLSQQGRSLKEVYPQDNMIEALEAYRSIQAMIDFAENCCLYLAHKTKEPNDKNCIKVIEDYIHRNISEDIRRDDIAEYVGKNPSYLSRLFKRETGINLKEYIIKEKMETAQKLLQSTSLTISMIAMKVGYSNFSLFTHNYKKITGHLPSEENKKIVGL
ncbi:response regulator transcription factor [Spirochaeta cellobiosiphila]|uniref:response regulator transcription factor n=1 Tax=Spirochaeta cellobiosiphila TaxID=504483 RepID=UPI00041E5236|nr:helix-turn-helix domain-containing protein [Spirochaeta cellobiosiphila]